MSDDRASPQAAVVSKPIVRSERPPDARSYASATREGFKRKADHNKTESLACFIAVISFTLVAPLFVTLGEGTLFGKVVPSVLSLCAAACTAWIQLRKPQTLWALYRDCQRRIEDALTQYDYSTGRYAVDAEEKERLLADSVRQVAWKAHEQWLPLVPTPDAINTKPTVGTERPLVVGSENA